MQERIKPIDVVVVVVGGEAAVESQERRRCDGWPAALPMWLLLALATGNEVGYCVPPIKAPRISRFQTALTTGPEISRVSFPLCGKVSN